MLMRCLMLLATLACCPSTASAESPKCDDPGNWATMSAFAQLKNSALTTSTRIVWDKVSVSLLASEQVGPDLYRQVHHIVYPQKDGGKIEIITRNNASSQECSMSSVEVYVISMKL